MKIINETRRKNLRYLMFLKRDGKPLTVNFLRPKQVKEVLAYYEGLEGFTSWDEFEWKWDIGLGGDGREEINTRVTRPEKWFLFDAPKSEIVTRPRNYWEKEAARRRMTTHALQQFECVRLNINRFEFFKKYF